MMNSPLPPAHADDLLLRADLVAARALTGGVLQPIGTESIRVSDRGLEFAVRWVSSLALKDQARIDTVLRRDPDFNPFLPPEPQLTVGAIGAGHLVVLNKFPAIERHLLIVTRAYEAQTAPLSAADFAVLATVVGCHGGLGFYNGGIEAGASQAHKHLQWVPEHGLEALAAGLPAIAAGECIAHPLFDWRHAFVRLPTAWPAGEAGGRMLAAAFDTACRQVGLPPDAEPMPPYNLLVNPDWLLLVPRRCEKWTDVSVNSLGFAGSLFARNAEQIERIRAAGPLAVLAAVGLPPAG
jgi:ATP adenylyltransferase